jgi:hypothetical protein
MDRGRYWIGLFACAGSAAALSQPAWGGLPSVKDKPRLIGQLRVEPASPASGSFAPLQNIPPGASRISGSQFGTVSASGSPIPAQTGSSKFSAMTASSAQPGVGACTTQNITNPNNGPVMTNPRINLLFWGNWNATTANNVAATWQRLAGLPALYSREAEYGVQDGSFGQRLPDYTSGLTGAQPDCVFAGGLSATLSSANFVPTSNDLFIILLPPNTSSKLDNDQGYEAHHGSYAYSGWGPAMWNYTTSTCTNNTNGACSGATYNSSANTCTATATGHVYSLRVNGTFYDIRYAVIESLSEPTLDVAISHELAEATTDPDGGSYGEIGDPCEGANASNFYNPYNFIQGVQVQKVWSQAACRCVGERDLNGSNLGLGTTVPTVYRPSDQTFWPEGSPWYFPTYPVGSPADPFIWDHDGDGYPDYATYYNASTSSVSTRLSQPPYYENTYNWGTSGDLFVPGDYDGDGESDLAVWRPSNGTWYVQYTSNGAYVTQQWGISTDIPYPGDFDGDGKTDFAVVRESNVSLYIIPSSNPSGAYSVWFGGLTSGDILTPGDYNGDGITDYAWWHPATGTWNVWYLNTDTAWTMNWGTSGDIPVARDYDGDWMTDLAVWRPSNGTWYTINSTTWTTTASQWGLSTDVPAVQFRAIGGF